MPKIDAAQAVVRTTTIYPAEFQARVQGRGRAVLGNLAGLTQFGVNLTQLKPGAASALRHWHEQEDEFVYVLEGEITLIEDSGETVLKPGNAAGFKAGVANGHHLVNKSERDAVLLEIGTRSPRERVVYSDVDLLGEKSAEGYRFTHKSGKPYSESE